MVYQVKLNKGELWNPELTKADNCLRIRHGKAWVTFENSNNDYILSEGQCLSLGDGILIESMTEELVLEAAFLHLKK